MLVISGVLSRRIGTQSSVSMTSTFSFRWHGRRGYCSWGCCYQTAACSAHAASPPPGCIVYLDLGASGQQQPPPPPRLGYSVCACEPRTLRNMRRLVLWMHLVTAAVRALFPFSLVGHCPAWLTFASSTWVAILGSHRVLFLVTALNTHR